MTYDVFRRAVRFSPSSDGSSDEIFQEEKILVDLINRERKRKRKRKKRRKTKRKSDITVRMK